MCSKIRCDEKSLIILKTKLGLKSCSQNFLARTRAMALVALVLGPPLYINMCCIVIHVKVLFRAQVNSHVTR